VAFGITQLLVLWYPTSGVLQALIHSWFFQNIQLLWIGSSAISATYYFLSKESGRTISAYYLATVGFWTYFLFAGWTAPASLLGGPIPVWIQSVGVITSLMMLVPIIILVINFFGTLSYNRGFAGAWNNTTLRFVLVGIVSFAASSLLNILFSTRSLNAIVRFTDFTVGQQQLANYGFVSMVIFGAAYYILPRVTGSFWPSAKLVHLHFWSSTIGGLGLALHLLICGYPTINSGVMSYYSPVIFFVLLQLVGHLAFAINSFVMLLASARNTNDNTHA
jgi:cytochrome c oxidase cbb3-type subunit 1